MGVKSILPQGRRVSSLARNGTCHSAVVSFSRQAEVCDSDGYQNVPAERKEGRCPREINTTIAQKKPTV